MKDFFVLLLCFGLRILFKLRYKVVYKGLDKVKAEFADRKNGILFLPNHPSVFSDPLIVTVPLLPQFHVRPLMLEHNYYHPFFHWAVRLINALPLPNLYTSFNQIKQRRMEKTLEKIGQGLKNGDCFLIYPSGTTKVGPREILGGAFGVHKLVSENPNIPVVLVRTTGLWGSMFSRALSKGESPEMLPGLKKSFWIAIKNLLFFVPKREVVVEFEIADKNLPRKASKNDFNRYLEEWYNRPFQTTDGNNHGEPLKLVSYAFWKEELPHVPVIFEEKIDLQTISEEVKTEIVNAVKSLSKYESNIQPQHHLVVDLGFDSLDLAQLLTFLEERYDITGINPEDLTTVSRLFLIASNGYKKPEAKEPEIDKSRWKKKKTSYRVSVQEKSKTIPDAFLRACDKNSSTIINADPRAGLCSYRNLKMKSLLLSEKIKNLPGERVGILLPASITCEVVVLATLLAGKTPVMINWTVGGKHLDAVVEVAKIEKVITSWTFLDNLDNVDITRIEDMLCVLEELRTEFSLLDYLRSYTYSYLPRKLLLAFPRYAHIKKIDENNEAVVLFTSGTEAMPKGVPLSHKNLLSNQRAILEALPLYSEDRILAMLPPFHSFGFAVTGLLPILSGIKAIYYPNPTESRRLAKAIKQWEVTVIASAPTFLRNILQSAEADQLTTLRLMVSGAEKAPEELFSLASKLCPNAKISEGYGITECSPVLSLNRNGDRDKGVGAPLPGVSFKIVDPEKFTLRNDHEAGLVLAEGPNVFNGYLKHEGKQAFHEIEGKKWYITGDLGRLDDQNNLILEGRLKRFVKMGGEMVSLAAIEEGVSAKMMEIFKSPEKSQAVVLSGKEEGDRPKLTLFITVPLEVSEINRMLRQKGFSNLIKIDKVMCLDAIPLTGTGKIAYRQLEKMLETN